MNVREVIRLRATETPFKEQDDPLGYAGLYLVQQSDSSTWDFGVRGLGYLCLEFPPRNISYSHVI